MKKLFALLIFVSLLVPIYGCQEKADEPKSSVFELKVSNNSNLRIYPVLSSGDSKQRFGVVGIGKSATIGFSPFKIEDKVTIEWREGVVEKEFQGVIDTTPLNVKTNNIYTLNLVYDGQHQWVIRVLDKEGNELERVTSKFS